MMPRQFKVLWVYLDTLKRDEKLNTEVEDNGRRNQQWEQQDSDSLLLNYVTKSIFPLSFFSHQWRETETLLEIESDP